MPSGMSSTRSGARARTNSTSWLTTIIVPGHDASAVETDLTRGTVPDVRPSTTYEGTISLGAVSVDDYEASVRRGAVIVQLISGVTTGSDPTTRAAVEQ